MRFNNGQGAGIRLKLRVALLATAICAVPAVAQAQDSAAEPETAQE